MEIEGKIILDLPLQSGTSKAGNLWKKKEWVLETFGQYPRKVKFDIFGDRVDTIRLEVGKTYRISYDLESREFNGRWYTDVRAYAAQETAAPGMAEPQAPYGAPAAPMYGAPAGQSYGTPASPVEPTNLGSSDTDDLPF